MNGPHPERAESGKISRRALLVDGLAVATVGAAGVLLRNKFRQKPAGAHVFIAKASSYHADLVSLVEDGLRHLGIGSGAIRGKRILLKPNFVETQRGTMHICTRPELIFAAAEVFRKCGAARVVIGEGPGHCRDTVRVLEETDMAGPLREYRVPFVDLNNDDLVVVPNLGGRNGLKMLTLPAAAAQADWIVSMPKMKTHHWVGVTLSMKNLFGLMPGLVYGWPKNVFHWIGIERTVLDINETVRPHLAIIDGIVGMDGDGPIMGTPKPAGVIVMSENPAAADASACRIMGIDPTKVGYLREAHGRLGTIATEEITQRGEPISAVRTDFELVDTIPAQRGLRLPRT